MKNYDTNDTEVSLGVQKMKISSNLLDFRFGTIRDARVKKLTIGRVSLIFTAVSQMRTDSVKSKQECVGRAFFVFCK